MNWDKFNKYYPLYYKDENGEYHELKKEELDQALGIDQLNPIDQLNELNKMGQEMVDSFKLQTLFKPFINAEGDFTDFNSFCEILKNDPNASILVGEILNSFGSLSKCDPIVSDTDSEETWFVDTVCFNEDVDDFRKKGYYEVAVDWADNTNDFIPVFCGDDEAEAKAIHNMFVAAFRANKVRKVVDCYTNVDYIVRIEEEE